MPHLGHAIVLVIAEVIAGVLVLTDVAIGVLATSSHSAGACVVTGEGADMHTVCDIDPDEPANIIFFCALELTQAAPQRFCLNENARENMWSMSATFDTSHFEMSISNNAAR